MASTSSAPLFARRAANAAKLGTALPPLAATPKLTIEIPKPDINKISRDQQHDSESGSCPSLTDGTQTPLTGSSIVQTPRSPRYTRQQEREWWVQCLEHTGQDEDCIDCMQWRTELPSITPSKPYECEGFSYEDEFPCTEVFPLMEEFEMEVPDHTECLTSLSYRERINKSYFDLGDTLFSPVAEMAQLVPGWNEKALQFFNQYITLLVLLLISVLTAYCIGRWTLPRQTGLETLSLIYSMPRVDAFVLHWDWDWANHTQV
ncbi:unnamed protein product [Clonostachys solani]|uniref:Uncharacterized protein n=1 Tax=Clonostachys solani TaxID=160281 RepID=A0A9P0ENR2_9HYPO|nr:unnamed protein product [Clonostachys solani]